MPNRNVHVPVGIAAAYAVKYYLHDKDSPISLAEFIGLGLGGYCGGRAPDIIDPPTSPNHRAIGHSILAAGGGTIAVATKVKSIESYCKNQARMAYEQNDLLLQQLWLLASGFSVGIIAGYASHLLLDSTTPSGLPLY